MALPEELRDSPEWTFADGKTLKVNYPNETASKSAARWTEALIAFCGLYGEAHPELVQIMLQGIIVEHHHDTLLRIERMVVAEF